MTFVKHNNLKAIMRSATGVLTAYYTDISGTSRSIYSTRVNSNRPFGTTVTTVTSPSEGNMCVYASGDEATASTYTISNQIGTSSTSYTNNNKGWTATITINGTQGDVIKSLLFVRTINYTNTSGASAIIFAVNLDNPVTIDSTGTANFTFAIEF